MHAMTVYGGRGARRSCRQLHDATRVLTGQEADRPTAGLDALEKREIPHSYQESNHDYPADHPAALIPYRIGYPWSSSTSSSSSSSSLLLLLGVIGVYGTLVLLGSCTEHRTHKFERTRSLRTRSVAVVYEPHEFSSS
jgi:hypothetical protein